MAKWILAHFSHFSLSVRSNKVSEPGDGAMVRFWPIGTRMLLALLMLYTLASVTNGPASPADATDKTAKSDEMYRIPSKQLPTMAQRNERLGAFVTLGPNYAVERKPRSAKSSALDHRRYVKAQVIAARSEAVWTPRTSE
jgi:hypothetical protein